MKLFLEKKKKNSSQVVMRTYSGTPKLWVLGDPRRVEYQLGLDTETSKEWSRQATNNRQDLDSTTWARPREKKGSLFESQGSNGPSAKVAKDPRSGGVRDSGLRSPTQKHCSSILIILI